MTDELNKAFQKLEQIFSKSIAGRFLIFQALLENRQTQNLKELDEEIFGFSESLDFQNDFSNLSENSQNQDYSILDEEDMKDQKLRMKKRMTKANLLYEQDRNNEMIQQFENLKNAAEKKQQFLNVINGVDLNSQRSEEMLSISHMPLNHSRILTKDEIKKQVNFEDTNNLENVLCGTLKKESKDQINLNSTLPKNAKLGNLKKNKNKKHSLKTNKGNLNVPVLGSSTAQKKRHSNKYKPVRKIQQEKPQMDHSFQLTKDDKKNMVNRTFIDGAKNNSKKKLNAKNQDKSFDEIIPQFQNNLNSISDVQQSQEFNKPVQYDNIFSFRQPVNSVQKKESLVLNEIIKEEKKSLEESFEQKKISVKEKLSLNESQQQLSIDKGIKDENIFQQDDKVQQKSIEDNQEKKIEDNQENKKEDIQEKKSQNVIQTLNMFTKQKKVSKKQLQIVDQQSLNNKNNINIIQSSKKSQQGDNQINDNIISKESLSNTDQIKQNNKIQKYDSKKNSTNSIQKQKVRDITLSFSLIQIKTKNNDKELFELSLKKTFENFEIYLQKRIIQIKRKTMFIMQLYDPLVKRANFLNQILAIDGIFFKQKFFAYSEIQKQILFKKKFFNLVIKKQKQFFLKKLHQNLVSDQILYNSYKKGFLKVIRLVERKYFLNIQESYVNLKLTKKKSKDQNLTANKNFVFVKKKTKQENQDQIHNNKMMESQMQNVFSMIEKILQNQNQNQQKILEELLQVIKSSNQNDQNKDLQKIIDLLQNQSRQNQYQQTQSDNTTNVQFQEILQFLQSRQHSQNYESNKSYQSVKNNFDYMNFALTFKLFLQRNLYKKRHCYFNKLFNFTEKNSLQDPALSIYKSYRKKKKNFQSQKSFKTSIKKNSTQDLQSDHNNLLYIQLEEEYMFKLNQQSNRKKILPVQLILINELIFYTKKKLLNKNQQSNIICFILKHNYCIYILTYNFKYLFQTNNNIFINIQNNFFFEIYFKISRLKVLSLQFFFNLI